MSNRTRLPLLLLVLFIVAGCTEDARELDQRSMIVAMAIDKGEEKEYRVTIQLPLLVAGQQGDVSPEGKEFEIFQAEADSVWDALVDLETQTPTVLFFGHMKVLAISETIAREGLDKITDLFDREATIANQIYLVIIEKGRAGDFIEQESPLVHLPGLYLSQFFSADQKIARSQEVKLFEFLRDSNMVSRASALPLAHLRGDKIVVEGMAIFKDYELKAKLREKQVGMNELLHTGEVDALNHTWIMETEEAGPVTVSLSRMSFKQSMSFDKKIPVQIHLDIKGHGELVHISTPEELTSTKFVEIVEKEKEIEVKKYIEETISAMKEINVEPWLFGHQIWAADPQYFEQLNWNETGWQDSEISISVEFHLKNTGQRALQDKKKIGR